MSKIWKALIVLSLLLNAVTIGGLLYLGRISLDAQLENLNNYQELSKDQQALRRRVEQNE